MDVKPTTSNPQLTPSLSTNYPQRVLVSGLSSQTTEKSLKSALSILGVVESVDLIPENGNAMVVFATPWDAQLACTTRFFQVDSKQVLLSPYKSSNKVHKWIRPSVMNL